MYATKTKKKFFFLLCKNKINIFLLLTKHKFDLHSLLYQLQQHTLQTTTTTTTKNTINPHCVLKSSPPLSQRTLMKII